MTYVRMCLMMLSFLVWSPGFGQEQQEDQTLVVLARQAYDEGAFEKAKDQYESLVDRGYVNGHLYYNLALTYYRLGNYGQSMAAFLGARDLMPRDPDVRANIKGVLVKVRDKVDAAQSRALVESVAFWIPRSTAKELAVWSLFATLLSSLFLWATALIPRLAGLRLWAWASLALPFVCLASLAVKTQVQQHWGAVVSEKGQAYSEPGAANTVVFELNEGAPFRLLDRHDQWMKIEVGGEKRGWIAANQVRVHGM